MSTLHDDDVVIVAAKRTPMGSMLGAFSEVSAPQLGAVAVKAVLADAAIGVDQIDEVILGNVVSAGLKQAPARQASRAAGIPDDVPCTTVNKVCGSGMKAIMYGYDQLRAGSAEVIVAGGMESMSRAPYLLERARQGLRMGHVDLRDSLFMDGLEDADTAGSMGSYGQQTADEAGFTREQMDAFAIASLERARQAQQFAWFKDEVAAVEVNTRRDTFIVEQDEQPAKANIEKIPSLKPAFKKEGTVTAATSSSMSDGAAVAMLMRAAKAEAMGCKPLAKVVAHASYAQRPSEFCKAPVGAMANLLKRNGWAVDAVDLFEINEAFAVVPMFAMRELGIAHDKVNIHGGACALGHPLGASGARLIVTLLHALQRTGGQRGVASLCIGGGEATAMAIELL